MTIKGADNVDIGCGNAFGGDDEAVDDSVEKVLSPKYHFTSRCFTNTHTPHPLAAIRYLQHALSCLPHSVDNFTYTGREGSFSGDTPQFPRVTICILIFSTGSDVFPWCDP